MGIFDNPGGWVDSQNNKAQNFITNTTTGDISGNGYNAILSTDPTIQTYGFLGGSQQGQRDMAHGLNTAGQLWTGYQVGNGITDNLYGQGVGWGGSADAGGLSGSGSGIGGGMGISDWIQGAGVLGGLYNSAHPPATPAAPDYVGAANATAAGNLALLHAQTQANRPNQYTPQGSVTWQQDANGNWTQNTKLSPEQQALYDQNNQTNMRLGNMAQGQMSNVQDALNMKLGNPGNINQQASDAAYANSTRYLDPQFQRQKQQLDSQLANQGIMQGSDAYNNEMSKYNEQKDMSYTNARNQAYTTGLQGANQMWNQGIQAQNQPLNMLNSLRTGQQIQTTANPNPGQFSNQGFTGGPDIMGATQGMANYNQGLYNSQMAQNSNLTNGLFSIANSYGNSNRNSTGY